MNWEAIEAISGIISAIAVIATLGYVAVQIRQNTHALRGVSRQAALQAELDLTSDWLERPELVDDHRHRSAEEIRYGVWRVKVLRVREFEWFQYQSGVLDEATWNSYMTPMPAMFGNERGRAILNSYGGSPEFKAYVNQWLDERPAK